MALRMTIFPTRSKSGEELLESVLPLVGTFGFKPKIIPAPAQSQVVHACAKDDAVLIDATVEPDGSHNYAAMTAQPMTMDHVLVVSRSYLPLNFHGLREGGAPSYPNQLTNSEIVSWIQKELRDLTPSLPRPGWKKSLLGSMPTVWSDLGKAAMRAQDRYQIFISFRNRDFQQVSALKRRIEAGEFHEGRRQGVLLFTPGELTFQDELLSALHRWHILSIVEERLRTCREMWIYEGPGYYDSWWTRSEILLLAYFQAVSGRRPMLRIFQPESGGRLIPEPRPLVPELSYEQRRAMDRLFSNTGRNMGAETAQTTRQLAELPILRNYRFFNDPVFSLDFLNQRLLEESVHHPGDRGTRIDPASILAMNDPPLRPVPKPILNDAERAGRAKLNGYEIRLEPKPRYLWYATRMGRLRGPEDTGELTLARQPVFRAGRS